MDVKVKLFESNLVILKLGYTKKPCISFINSTEYKNKDLNYKINTFYYI